MFRTIRLKKTNNIFNWLFFTLFSIVLVGCENDPIIFNKAERSFFLYNNDQSFAFHIEPIDTTIYFETVNELTTQNGFGEGEFIRRDILLKQLNTNDDCYSFANRWTVLKATSGFAIYCHFYCLLDGDIIESYHQFDDDNPLLPDNTLVINEVTYHDVYVIESKDRDEPGRIFFNKQYGILKMEFDNSGNVYSLVR